jgi:hypothetical protein
MSDPKLEEIRARLEAATPGPWPGEVEIERSFSDYRVPSRKECEEECLFSAFYTILGANHGGALCGTYGDLTLILHAPTDIAWLVKRIEELEEELESASVPTFRYESEEPKNG